jgi:hypothetical protein
MSPEVPPDPVDRRRRMSLADDATGETDSVDRCLPPPEECSVRSKPSESLVRRKWWDTGFFLLGLLSPPPFSVWSSLLLSRFLLSVPIESRRDIAFMIADSQKLTRKWSRNRKRKRKRQTTNDKNIKQ